MNTCTCTSRPQSMNCPVSQDICLLHPDLAHAGGPNFSANIRSAVYFRLRCKDWEKGDCALKHRTNMWGDLPGVSRFLWHLLLFRHVVAHNKYTIKSNSFLPYRTCVKIVLVLLVCRMLTTTPTPVLWLLTCLDYWLPPGSGK